MPIVQLSRWQKGAGSEKDFVDMMKAKLLEWGIQDATLVNTTGLNNETLGNNIYPGSKKDDENKLSAYDVAVVARNLILKYPQVFRNYQETFFYFCRDDYSFYKLYVRGITCLSWWC